MKTRLLPFVLGLVLLAGCGGFYNISMGRRADGSTRVSVGFAEDEAKNLIHRRSGMVFPPAVAGFERDFVYIYDSHGGDVSVRYNLAEPAECFLDVYVYPSYGALEKHVAETKAAIEAYHDNARLVSEAALSHEHAGTAFTGVELIYSYRVKFRKEEQAAESVTWLFMYGASFIQYRVTYPEAAGPALRPRLEAFREGLAWP